MPRRGAWAQAPRQATRSRLRDGSAGQFVFSKQLLRTSFRRPAVGTPRTSGNGELIHLMQNDGFLLDIMSLIGTTESSDLPRCGGARTGRLANELAAPSLSNPLCICGASRRAAVRSPMNDSRAEWKLEGFRDDRPASLRPAHPRSPSATPLIRHCDEYVGDAALLMHGVQWVDFHATGPRSTVWPTPGYRRPPVRLRGYSARLRAIGRREA